MNELELIDKPDRTQLNDRCLLHTRHPRTLPKKGSLTVLRRAQRPMGRIDGQAT